MTRWERWVGASAATERFEEFMIVVTQGLGRLDVSLIEADEAFLAHDKPPLPEAIKFMDRLTVSYLWVLGAYELIRTICQRIKERPGLVSDEAAASFLDLKKRYSRLRMPLAKMEAAAAHKGDSPIAYPTLHRQKGVAWQLTASEFETRRDLADGLLTTLEGVKS